MIDDSRPWREELFRTARRLRARKDQTRWTERSHYLVERDVMVGAYAVRKLIDSEKTSSLLSKRQVQVVSYPLVGRRLYALTNDQVDRAFDFANPSKHTLTVEVLCNQFVHSLVFMLEMEGDAGLTGVLVASDSASKKWLHHVSIDAIADLFDYVAREDVFRFRGSMIAGVMVTTRTSQHDLVEAHEAEYTDESRAEVRLFDDPEQVYRDALTQAISKGLDSLP